MMKTRSHEDPIAIQQTCYDEKLGAMRMVIVGSGFGESSHVQKVQSGQVSPNQVVVKETEVKIVEVPTIVIQKEVQVIELPTYVVQTEYKTIEVPIITKEIQIVEVPTYIKGDTIEILKEVPVYVTQTNTEYKDLPKWLVGCLVLQTTCTLIFSILKFLK